MVLALLKDQVEMVAIQDKPALPKTLRIVAVEEVVALQDQTLMGKMEMGM